jgi:hypothetical protein
MAVAQAALDPVIRFLTGHPFLVALLVGIVGLIFFLYFLVRRSLLSARQGYEERARR